MSTYDSRNVTLQVGPFTLSHGLAQEGFVSIEASGEAFVVEQGANGDFTRYATHNYIKTITITLRAHSKHNAQLSALHEVDKASKQGAGVMAFLLKDNNGTSLHATGECWIQTPPADALGSVSNADKVWTLQGNFKPGSSVVGGW